MQLNVLYAATPEQLCLQKLFDLHLDLVRGGPNERVKEELLQTLALVRRLGLDKRQQATSFELNKTPYLIWPSRLVAYLENRYE